MYQTIKYEVHGHTATITLNRPDALNALSPHMITELRAAYQQAEDDDTVWLMIVTATGRTRRAEVAAGRARGTEAPGRARREATARRTATTTTTGVAAATAAATCVAAGARAPGVALARLVDP